MSTSPPDDQPRELERPDEIDQLFGRGNPNPDRVGCPPRDVTIALARRSLPLSDPGYKHLTACSPCYLEVRAIQESDLEERRRRLIGIFARGAAAVAAVLVLIVAGWFFLRDRRATEVRVKLDLRPYALTRGEPAARDRQPLTLPRARVALTLLLPAGSEPGSYEVQILDIESKLRAATTGLADTENQVTTLRSGFDLHTLPSGQYQLSIGRGGEERRLFAASLR